VPTIAATSAGQPPAAPLDGTGSRVPESFAAFAEAFAGVKSYRAKVSLETPGQPKIEANLDAVLPDRFRVNVTGGVGINFELISLGDEVFMKLGGSWQRTPAEALLPFSPLDLQREARDLTRDVEVVAGDPENVDGARCEIFSVTRAATGQSAEYCVAAGNAIRRFTKIEGATRVTLVFSDVNAGISIKAPI